MGPILGAAALAGGASLVGNLLGGIFGKSSQSQANKTNLQIARETNEANERINQANLDWQRTALKSQQDYASFVNQRRMAEEAGINPYSALGNAALGGQAGTPVSHAMQGASVSPEDAFGRALSGAALNSANVVASLAAARKSDAEAKGQAIDNITRGAQNAKILEMSGLQADAQRLQNTLNEQLNPELLIGQRLANQQLTTNIAISEIERDIKQFTHDKIQPAQLEEILKHVALMVEQGATEKTQQELNRLLGKAHITSANAQMLQAKVAQMKAPSEIGYNNAAAANQYSQVSVNEQIVEFKRNENSIQREFGAKVADAMLEKLNSGNRLTDKTIEKIGYEVAGLRTENELRFFKSIIGSLIPIAGVAKVFGIGTTPIRISGFGQ